MAHSISTARLPRVLLVLWLLCFALLTAEAQTPAPETTPLPVQAVERELAGGQTHSYTVTLAANEFLQARAEQRGVDITLRLLDANGQVLAEMDSPNGKQGPETLTLVAAQAGGYALEVSSLDAKAEKASYILQRTLARPATPQDRRRVEVERVFVVGVQKSIPPDQRDEDRTKLKVQLDDGLSQLEEAQRGWTELGEESLAQLTAQVIVNNRANRAFFVDARIDQLYQESSNAEKVKNEGRQLLDKSVANALAARARLQEALSMFRTLNAKVQDKSLLDKINQTGPAVAQKLLPHLKTIEFSSTGAEASILGSLADTHQVFGEWREVIEYRKLEVSAYQASQKQVEEIPIKDEFHKILLSHAKSLVPFLLSGIGSIYDNVFSEPAEAIKYTTQALEQSRALFQETQDKKFKVFEADMLVRLAYIYGKESRGRAKAIEHVTQAIAIYRALPDQKQKLARGLQQLSGYHLMDFDFVAAQKSHDAARQIYRELGDKIGEEMILHPIALMYWLLDDKPRVQTYTNQMLVILESPDYAEEFRKANNLPAGVSDSSDQVTANLSEYARLSGLQTVYTTLEHYPKLLEYNEKALLVAKSAREPDRIRVALSDVGFANAKLEKWDKALEYYRQALAISRQGKARENIAKDLTDVGRALLETGRPQEALKCQTEALMLFQSVGIDGKTVFSTSYSTLLSLLARTYDALGNRQLAIFYGKQGVNALQGERQRLQNLGPAAQKGFLQRQAKHYRRLADWLIAEGLFAQAEEVLRMLKQEEYFDFVRRDAEEIKRLSQRVGFDAKQKALLARYEELAGRITAIGLEVQKLEERKGYLSRANLKLSPDEQKRYDELSAQLTAANAAFQLFLDTQLKTELGAEKAAKIEVDRSLQGEMAQWGAGTVHLRTVVGEDRYRVILTTPTVQVDGKYEIKIADLNQKVFAFRAALQDPTVDPRPLAKELYDILLKPIEKELQASGAETLVWSLDGTLRYIPLAALSPDGSHYLMEKYRNVVITAKRGDFATANTAWRALGLGISNRQTVANPDPPNDPLNFPALPGAKAELLSIVRANPREKGALAGQRYLDQDFTAGAFMDALAARMPNGQPRFTVVHIASHFRLGPRPESSFLVLGDGQALTLHQFLTDSKINFGAVDLITLSACNTAFSDTGDGHETDSLADVIQTRGGKAVMASLWAVADDSTSLLMAEFYRLRQAHPTWNKAEALRQAQLKLLYGQGYERRANSPNIPRSSDELEPPADGPPPKYTPDAAAPFAHPYYWSPFILLGNWR